MSNSDKPGLMATPAKSQGRIESLDQFRGYTIAGMLLVNFLGSFAACPLILKHSHDYVSYADTIMPQFLFAVGFAFRLTFGRRAQLHGASVAYMHMVRRLLGLVLISIVIYTVSPPAETWAALKELGVGGILPGLLKRNWFQTLMHIAVTSLWILPVIRAGVGVRLTWMLLSAIAHVGLSYWFNFVWVNTSPNGIDGGPLAFLVWTIPAMLGTFACDAVAGAEGRPRLGRMVVWSLVIMGLGYVFSCGTRLYDVPPSEVEALKGQKLAAHPVFPPLDRVKAHFEQDDLSAMLAEPPFVPPPDSEHRKWNYWMMSQRAGSLSYLTFCGGFSLLVYVLFYVACDIYRFRSSFLHSFGVNALAAYILHEMVGEAVKPFVPRDSPGWYVTGALVLYFAINYVIIRHLEKQKIFLKL